MKKNYQKPSITVVELENSCVLLAGSNPLPEGYEQVRFTGEDYMVIFVIYISAFSSFITICFKIL